MNAKVHWAQPDFLATRRRAPAVAWLAAVAGVALLGATLVEGSLLQRQVDAQVLALAALQRASAPAASTARTAAPDAADPRAMRAAHRIAAQLAHPWGQVLADVETQAPVGAQWLLLDHDTARADLRLQGTAPEARSALELVDALGARGGWSSVALSRLQAPERRDEAAAAATGAGLWRFDIAASVDPQALAARDADDGH